MSLGISGPESTTPTAQDETYKLEQAFHNGANWFYWIAGLSIVNTVIQMLGSDWSFIVGLGITQLVDGIAREAGKGVTGGTSAVLHVVAIVFDFFAIGFFALMGFLANKRHSWAFIVGMIFYALDGLLFLLLQSWLSIAFHIFALIGIWGGFANMRKLNAAEVQAGLRPIGPS
ncbi:MAG: hypothetical protein MUF51_07365 [Vicinamibacteria bacterium]|jgi:hypothetical protein|nr:hypothetical protein [Vicinamibacteria bacterium]